MGARAWHTRARSRRVRAQVQAAWSGGRWAVSSVGFLFLSWEFSTCYLKTRLLGILKEMAGWQVTLTFLFSPEAVIRTLVRGGFPEEKNLLSLKMDGAERNLNGQAVLNVPTVLLWAHTLSHSPITFDSSSNPVQKCKRLRISLGHFIMKVFVSHKTCIKETCMLSSC